MHIYERIGNLFANVYRPIVFELGAHLGWDTKRMLAVFHDPILYALEPDSRNLPALRKSFQRLVHVVPAAIGARDGATTLFHSTTSMGIPHAGASSIHAPGAVAEWATFDRLCAANGIRHVDFIWADVQGAEGDMILGGERALRHTMYLYTEYSNLNCYEGQWTMSQILEVLSGWEVIENYEPADEALSGDVLLKNARYARERAEHS
jgi:FkbM family methyltransferase